MLTISSIDGPDDKEFILWLYGEFNALMLSTAKKYVSNPQDCEDILQDSLEKLIKKIDLLRSKERCILCAYVVSTVRNTAINFLKRQDRIQSHTSTLKDGDSSVESPALPLEELAVLTERKELLARIWPRLSREEQALLSGKYILGSTDEELAEEFQCKAASIRMKLTRARRKALRFMLEKEGLYDQAGTI